jgi:hypothetical protein
MARIQIKQLEAPAEVELGAAQAGKVVGAGPVIVGGYGGYVGYPAYGFYGGVVNVTPNWGTVLGPGGYTMLPSPYVLGPGVGYNAGYGYLGGAPRWGAYRVGW